jgi:hypothetical protein
LHGGHVGIAAEDAAVGNVAEVLRGPGVRGDLNDDKKPRARAHKSMTVALAGSDRLVRLAQDWLADGAEGGMVHEEKWLGGI